MALRFVGNYSGYLPKETGQVVAFCRKKEQFKLNSYCQWVDAPTKLGVYSKYERDQFVRLTDTNMHTWADGDDRPKGLANKLRKEMADFRCLRKSFDWELGYEAVEHAKNFSLKPAHMAAAVSQAMTELTQRVITVLQTASNWGSNVADANTLNGGRGKWSTASDDPNSPNYNAIFLTLTAVADVVNLLTNANVQPKDLRVVLSPTAARLTAASPEMTNYCRESPHAKEILEKGLDPTYSAWGLPSQYKGFEFVVEDAPIVTDKPNEDGTEATTGRTRIKNDTSAIMMSRPGGLDGEFGTPSFSTIQLYHYGPQLEVEAFDAPEHRKVNGHVTTNVAVELAAAIAGHLVTNIL